MELWIALAYAVGIVLMIVWMCNIDRFATWASYKLVPDKKATRAHGGAAQAARDVNRKNFSIGKGERQDGKAVHGRYQARKFG